MAKVENLFQATAFKLRCRKCDLCSHNLTKDLNVACQEFKKIKSKEMIHELAL